MIPALDLDIFVLPVPKTLNYYATFTIVNILERALIGEILFVTGQPVFQDVFDNRQFDNPYTGDVKAMKIRIRTFAKVKDILGADSFLECQDGTPMKELLKALRERAGESEDQLFSKWGSAQ